MSSPQKGSTEIKISIPAKNAILLAEEILEVLSQVGKFQQTEVEKKTYRTLSDAKDDGSYGVLGILGALNNLRIAENVTLTILPDKRSPNSSGYDYYTTPGD